MVICYEMYINVHVLPKAEYVAGHLVAYVSDEEWLVQCLQFPSYCISQPIRRTFFPQKMWPKFGLRLMCRG